MGTEPWIGSNRREFLKAAVEGLATFAGLSAAYRSAGLFRLPELGRASASGRLETTRVRLPGPNPAAGEVDSLAPFYCHLGRTGALIPAASIAQSSPDLNAIRLLQFSSTCQVPLYIAEEFLRREGFTAVEYVPSEQGVAAANLARGEVDIGMNFVGPNIVRLDAGDPIVIVAGGHIGCFELFASRRVRAIRDLKGKQIAIGSPKGEVEHIFLSAILAHIGLDPEHDVNWVIPEPEKWADKQAEAIKLLSEDKVDAYLAFPPTTLDMRARRIGHIILKSVADRPWSQYFCCMVIAHRDFVRLNPVATKRALRAILSAADLVAREPVRAARLLAARFKGMPLHGRYDYALKLIREIPYGEWRDYDPEDTLRFYALRLREGGIIRGGPQQLIARGTDWRFLTELKKEMKG